MKRKASIEALLRKAKGDVKSLNSEYKKSLEDKHVHEDLKVLIKNIFENLRSCLDYLAQDIFEKYCSSVKKPKELYFPIRMDAVSFLKTVSKDFPDLQTKARDVFNLLESVQPFHDPWLGQFNKLNNNNKHQDLVEQTRSDSKGPVTVSRERSSVAWDPLKVKYGSGVKILDVSIDPRTQMPVPDPNIKIKVVIWVDFRFKEINESVLMFIEASIRHVEKIFNDLQRYI